MEVICDSETPERSVSERVKLSEIDWGVELAAVVCVFSFPVLSPSGPTKRGHNLSHKILRRIRLVL
jgi:hypothetical protein